MRVRVPHRPINVTPEIQLNHKIYGSSDHNTPWSFAASKSLNYVDGPSLQRPHTQTINKIETTERWEDAVGLFGAENKFIKYDFKLNPEILDFYEDPGYGAAAVNPTDLLVPADYQLAQTKIETVPDQGTYEQAVFSTDSPVNPTAGNWYISVEIFNHGVSNIHQDDWFDARIYSADRIEHPYTKAYLKHREFFYVGFHARNTRRLPYKVDVRIGAEVVRAKDVEDPRMILRPIWQGAY